MLRPACIRGTALRLIDTIRKAYFLEHGETMKIVAKMGHWSSVVGGGVLLTDDGAAALRAPLVESVP